jgi:succinate dehydrogenase/fumarate reductase flavoprotein subunit
MTSAGSSAEPVEAHDVIVIGGGAGGMAAAAVAAAEGLDVLLLEKSDRLGGTTAISGGMVWVPANRPAATAGLSDTRDAARAYLAALIPDPPAALDAFIDRAAEAVDYLAQHTAVRLRPVRRYPDYYPDLPGATLGGRVLEPEPFDARSLGRHFALLAPPLPEFMLMGGMMVAREDLPAFRALLRSLPATLRVARLVSEYAAQRLTHPRGTSLVLGNALCARLLHSLLIMGVSIRTAADVTELLCDRRDVGGVVANGQKIRARRGVVLATGGFSHDAALRRALLPPAAGALSVVAPAARGDGIRLGRQIGAALAGRGAFWVPVSRFIRADGTTGLFPHTVTDRGKPGVVAVGADGRRFVNEARSYHEFVRAMMARNLETAYLICDRRFLWRYGLGAIRPMTPSLRHWRNSGYLAEAPSVEALAGRLAIPPGALAATIRSFNHAARHGEDPEFGRGGDPYQRHMGDPAHEPNPCVAPIEHPPFHAIALQPADLGTSAGLATDGHARVLDQAGAPIGGLYAAGNDLASVMNGTYPGPGITLGPALTFAYLAARHLASRATGV